MVIASNLYGYEGMEHWSFSARASAQTGRVIKPSPQLDDNATLDRSIGRPFLHQRAPVIRNLIGFSFTYF